MSVVNNLLNGPLQPPIGLPRSCFSKTKEKAASLWAQASQFFKRNGSTLANAAVDISTRLVKVESNIGLETVKGVAYPLVRSITWAAQTAVVNTCPAVSPKNLIEQTNALAKSGIEIEKAKGTPVTAEKSLLDSLSKPAPPDPDDTDWHAKIDDAARDLSKKLSAFTALSQMHKWAGIKDVAGTDTLDLMDLARQAAENPNTSIWKLFRAKYHPTFFQSLKAGFFYLVFYPHLLSSTIDSYLLEFINVLKTKLTEKGDHTRNQIFETLLNNLYTYSLRHYDATKAFAEGRQVTAPNGKIIRTLEEWRNYHVEQQYNFDLNPICDLFSAAMMEASSSVTVPLLSQTLKKIPFIGWVLRGFELFVNRFIIRKIIYSALPNIMQNVISNGIELTQPSNLPFSIAIARFLGERLEEILIEKPSSLGSSGAIDKTSIGNGILPKTIEQLKTIIHLAPYKGTFEILREINKLKKAQPGIFDLFDSAAEEAIKESIVEAGNALFRYLNGTARSGKLFENLLKKAASLFEKSEKDPQVLARTFEKEKSNVNKLAALLFNRILDSEVPPAIEKSIDSLFPSFLRGTTKDVRTATKKLIEKENLAIDLTLKEIQNRVGKIEAKIRNFGQDNRLAIDNEILKVLENIRDLTCRGIFQPGEIKKDGIESPIYGLSAIDQDALWRQLNRFYEKLAAFTKEDVLKLQELQKERTQFTEVQRELEKIAALCQSLRNGQKVPGWQQSLVDHLERLLPYNKIPQLAAIADVVRKTASELGKEAAALEEIDEIPLHLQELYDYEQNKHPWRYSPKTSLAQIEKVLQNPQIKDAEKQAFLALIGNGTGMLGKKDLFASLLKKMKTAHQNTHSLCQNRLLILFSDAWIQRTIQTQEKEQKKIQNEMQAKASNLSAELKKTIETFKHRVSPLAPALTPLREKSTALALSALGSLAHPALGTVLSLFSHLVWRAEYDKPENSQSSGNVDPQEDPKERVQKMLKGMTSVDLPEDPKERVQQIERNTLKEKVIIGGQLATLLAAPSFLPTLPVSTEAFRPIIAHTVRQIPSSAASAVAGGLGRNRLYAYIKDAVIAPKVQKLFHGFVDLCFDPASFFGKATVVGLVQSGEKGLRKIALEKKMGRLPS